MQTSSWSRLILATALLSIFQACDETESTLGGLPGGQVMALADSVGAQALRGYHRPQDMVAASRHCVGRSDSIGLESVIIFRLDYQPVEEWSPTPEADPFTAFIGFKMDNNPALAWFPQISAEQPEPGESGRFLDLELILLRDSLNYEDLGWESAFLDDALSLAELDRVQFRVSDADTVFGTGGDPLAGRRTYRQIPTWWFQHADTSARWLMLRATPGQQGIVPILAAGYAGELRPRVRFASIHVDSLLIDGVQVPDTSWDTTFVSATWQTSLIRDQAVAGLNLSTGWAGQVLTQLPPFPPDASDPLFDPVSATLVEAWLRVPLGGVGFNAKGTKVNLYMVDSLYSDGVDLDPAQLVASDVADSTAGMLEFNLTPHLRRVWVEDDSLDNTNPVILALKVDDYNLLQLRKISLADTALVRPRLVYSLSQAPGGWGRP